MKKLLSATLCLCIFYGVSLAMTSGSGWYNPARKFFRQGTAVRLASGLVNYGRINLINGSTDYVGYDLYTTSATPGTTRIFLTTVIAAPHSYEQLDLNVQQARDLTVVISTYNAAGDGGLDQIISYEYK